MSELYSYTFPKELSAYGNSRLSGEKEDMVDDVEIVLKYGPSLNKGNLPHHSCFLSRFDGSELSIPALFYVFPCPEAQPIGCEGRAKFVC